ncbi:hypothetical protein M9458_004447, partial [Cirrhinus mrigala]
LVANTTSYPDDALCAFYDASLNASCRAPSSEDGPRADFAAFVEWTLARNKLSFSVCSMENLASATPDPEPSLPASRHAEFEPEPRATEPEIATEPEPYTSDQVREPATATATGECNMEQVRAMESPAHCITAG